MDNITTAEFIRFFLPIATAVEQQTGMPRIYSLAMHITEQGRNSHPPGNMCFGIKPGPRWTGKRQLLRTWEVFDSPHMKWPHEVFHIIPRADGKYRYDLLDEFRAYDTIQESYLDHAAFLKQNPRYAAAWLVGASVLLLYQRAELCLVATGTGVALATLWSVMR